MRYRRRIYRGKDTRQENRKWFIIGEMQVAGIQRAGNRRQDTGGGHKTPYCTECSVRPVMFSNTCHKLYRDSVE
jgi:hypothetical protein